MKKIPIYSLEIPIGLLSQLIYGLPMQPDPASYDLFFSSYHPKLLGFIVLDQETTRSFGDTLGSIIKRASDMVNQSTHDDLFRKWREIKTAKETLQAKFI